MRRFLTAPPLAASASNEPRSRLIGIGLICAALLCFAFLDTTAKWLSQHVDALEVVWVRYAGHFFLSFVFVNPWTVPGLLSTRRPWQQIGRSALLYASTVFNFVGLQYLQLDQASVIAFTTPFFVAALAGPLLGEWIGWRRWMAILAGFGGIVLVARPGVGGIHPAAILLLLCSFCYALYNVSTRVLAGHDSTATTVFYSALVGFLAASIPLPAVWTTPTDPWVIAALLATGAYGWIGHLFLIIAHRYAPAAILAPFIYTQIIWYVAGGFFVFGDIPNGWTLAGAVIVITSGLYMLNRERRRKGEF